jgi:hypothetical protein
MVSSNTRSLSNANSISFRSRRWTFIFAYANNRNEFKINKKIN